MAGAPDEEREALSPGACYLVGRPSKEDAAVDLVKVMKKRSVRVKIQGVVRVQVTTGESEMSVGREGDTLGAKGGSAEGRVGHGGQCREQGGAQGGGSVESRVGAEGGGVLGRVGHRLQLLGSPECGPAHPPALAMFLPRGDRLRGGQRP